MHRPCDPPASSLRVRLSVAAALFALLAACAGDTHDDDGGVLMGQEEQRVKDWLRELGPLIQEVGDIDWFSITFSSVTGISSGPTVDEIKSLMRRVSRTRPPIVENLDANQAMREFHGALRERADSVIEHFEHVENFGIGFMSFPWLEEDYESMDAAENSLQYHGQQLAGKIATDFQDDPEFQRELQVLFNTVSNLFSNRGRLRTLPSMLGSAPLSPLPTGAAPPPSPPPSGYGTPSAPSTGGLGPLRKLPNP